MHAGAWDATSLHVPGLPAFANIHSVLKRHPWTRLEGTGAMECCICPALQRSDKANPARLQPAGV